MILPADAICCPPITPTVTKSPITMVTTKIEPMTEQGEVVLTGGRPSPKAVAAKRKKLEARIKKLNSWILCSYPLPAASSFPEDQCRPQATGSEWQGTAAALIKAAYGGDGLPSPTFRDTHVPASWLAAGQSTLYTTVVAPACRA